MLFFKYCATRHGLGLQKIYHTSVQLKGMQSCDLSKLEVIGHFGLKATFYQINLTQPDSTWTGGTPLFWTSNFDRSQFCSPLNYDDQKQLISKPQAIYTLDNNQKNSIPALLRSDTTTKFPDCQQTYRRHAFMMISCT